MINLKMHLRTLAQKKNDVQEEKVLRKAGEEHTSAKTMLMIATEMLDYIKPSKEVDYMVIMLSHRIGCETVCLVPGKVIPQDLKHVDYPVLA